MSMNPSCSLTEVKRKIPSRDPNSPKHRDDSGFRWYGGAWRTEAGIERHRDGRRIKEMTPEQIERQRKRARKRDRDKRIADPVWAVEQDIQRVANAHLQQRRETYGYGD